MNFNFLKNWFSDYRGYVAEFLGTLIFVFICQVIVLSGSLYGNVSFLEKAIAIGFSYCALVFATSNLSGGFLNPAIVIALWLVQRFTTTKTVFYLICQILAGFVASAAVILLFGQEAIGFNLGIANLGINVDLKIALILEAILTAGLVFSVFGTMVDRNGPVSFGPIALGFYLTGATLAAGAVSGGVFNPARVIGASVLSRNFEYLAVFVIGPLIGSLMGMFYEFTFIRKGKKKG